MNQELYEDVLTHMRHHNVKRWLLEGAKLEDARTIWWAIDRMDEDTLKRRLARALAKDR